MATLLATIYNNASGSRPSDATGPPRSERGKENDTGVANVSENGGHEVRFAASTPIAPAASNAFEPSPVEEAYEHDCRMEVTIAMSGFKGPEMERSEFLT